MSCSLQLLTPTSLSTQPLKQPNQYLYGTPISASRPPSTTIQPPQPCPVPRLHQSCYFTMLSPPPLTTTSVLLTHQSLLQTPPFYDHKTSTAVDRTQTSWYPSSTPAGERRDDSSCLALACTHPSGSQPSLYPLESSHHLWLLGLILLSPPFRSVNPDRSRHPLVIPSSASLPCGPQ
jgi:hypothetical protein